MRLLFATLTGHGHITPTLPLVEELVRRGHRVDYATAAEHADAVSGAGARWVALPPMAPFRPPARIGPDAVAAWFRHFFAALSATYPVLRAHCVAERPDGICYDATNWPARLVAGQLGVPAVRLLPNLASNESFSVDEKLMAGLDADHPAMAALADDCARFSAEHGVHLDVEGTMEVVEALNLVFVPREFQPGGETFDERFRFIGPLLGGREPWSPREPGAPLLFVSLGTVLTGDAAFYRACAEAFADGTWQVAMVVADPGALGPLPATVEARPWFPQPSVLRHATAFITHAGMGSTMEALAEGVPLVAFPGTPEQVANAERVQELGLGEHVGEAAPTAAALREVVTRVAADPAVRAALDRMREAIRAAGGATRGADEVERHVGGRG